MSCIYGPRQLGTEDQGWVAHFLIRALRRPADQHLRRRPAGPRRAVRRGCGRRLSRRLAAGSTPSQGRRSTSAAARPTPSACCRCSAASSELTGRTPDLRFADWRPGDQRYFVADTTQRAPGARPRRARSAGATAWPGSPPGSRPSSKAVERGRAVKVALVNPPWTFDGSIYFGCREPHLPLELGYTRALLERDGHEVLHARRASHGPELRRARRRGRARSARR